MKLQQVKLSGNDNFTPGSNTLVVNFGGPTVVKDKSFIQFSASLWSGGTYPNNTPYEFMVIPQFSSVSGGNASAITFTRGPSVDGDELEITWSVFHLAEGTVEHLPVTQITSFNQNIPIPAGKWTDDKSFIISNFYTTFGGPWNTDLDSKLFQTRHVEIIGNHFAKVKGRVNGGSEYAALQVVTLPNAFVQEVISPATGINVTSATFTAVDISKSMHFTTYLSENGTLNMNETHLKNGGFFDSTRLIYSSYAFKNLEAVSYIIEDPDIFAQHGEIIWFNNPGPVMLSTAIQEEHSIALINGQVGYWGRSSSTTVLDFARWGMRADFNNKNMMTTTISLFRGSLSGLECKCQMTAAEFTLDPSPVNDGHDQYYRMNNRRRA